MKFVIVLNDVLLLLLVCTPLLVRHGIVQVQNQRRENVLSNIDNLELFQYLLHKTAHILCTTVIVKKLLFIAGKSMFLTRHLNFLKKILLVTKCFAVRCNFATGFAWNCVSLVISTVTCTYQGHQHNPVTYIEPMMPLL